MNKKVLAAFLISVIAVCALSVAAICIAVSIGNREVVVEGGVCVHTYGNPDYIPATCTSMGYELSVCTQCGNKDYTFVPAKGHVWSNGAYVTKPDCDHSGIIRYTCTQCRIDKTEVILPYGHLFEDGLCIECGTQEFSRGLEFKLSSDGSGYILTGLGTYTGANLIIPETYEGLPVTAISMYDSDFIDKITSISIPRFVITYSSLSWSLPNLESVYFNAENCIDCSFKGSGGENGIEVVIGKAVRSIHGGFSSENIKSIRFEEGSVCRTIGGSAFSGSAITEIEIPTSVRVIGARAFFNCKNLKSVKMTWGVEEIEAEAFANCENLENFDMSTDIKLLGERFVDSRNNIKYNRSQNLFYLGNEKHPNLVLMDVALHAIETCTISPETKIIYATAFENCNSLKAVNVPEGVISVGGFANCGSLKELNIPSSVTHIETGFSSGFYCCYSLTKITVDSGNKVYYEKDGCIIEKATKTVILGCNSAVIPDDGSVTAIGDWAFYSMEPQSFVNLVIPEGVTSIGAGAFSRCGNIESVALPKSLTHLGKYAFRDCEKLKNIVIPEGITQIGEQTFMGCKSLEYVVIPTNVILINDGAFTGCEKLTQIFYTGTRGEWEKILVRGTAWPETVTIRFFNTGGGFDENAETVIS